MYSGLLQTALQISNTIFLVPQSWVDEKGSVFNIQIQRTENLCFSVILNKIPWFGEVSPGRVAAVAIISEMFRLPSCSLLPPPIVKVTRFIAINLKWCATILPQFNSKQQFFKTNEQTKFETYLEKKNQCLEYVTIWVSELTVLSVYQKTFTYS